MTNNNSNTNSVKSNSNNNNKMSVNYGSNKNSNANGNSNNNNGSPKQVVKTTKLTGLRAKLAQKIPNRLDLSHVKNTIELFERNPELMDERSIRPLLAKIRQLNPSNAAKVKQLAVHLKLIKAPKIIKKSQAQNNLVKRFSSMKVAEIKTVAKNHSIKLKATKKADMVSELAKGMKSITL